MKALLFPLVSVATLMLASCTQYQQQGALIGGIGGALLGAAFGDDHQDVVAGAAVGAGVGAGAAALKEDADRKSGGIPYGTKTETPSIIASPHPPYQRVNVAGYYPGQIVRDPTTKKLFRLP